MRRPFLIFLPIMLSSACSVLSKLTESPIKSDYYLFKEHGKAYEKVYAKVSADSIFLIKQAEPGIQYVLMYSPDQKFMKVDFDFEVLIMPFKYRPGSPSLPRQLTAQFNGNIFAGIKAEKHHIKIKHTPMGSEKHFKGQQFSLGLFSGIGSAAVTPWTTNYQITDEYMGLVVSRGVAALVGFPRFTFGLGMGWDSLTDRDKHIWIYQNQPWYGLSISLNLN